MTPTGTGTRPSRAGTGTADAAGAGGATGPAGTAATGPGVLQGVQRHGRGGDPATHRIRVTGLVLLGAHLAFVGWLTLRPLSVPWVAPANLEPFATIRSGLADGPREALSQFGGGLLLLAPLGILLPLATGRLHRSLTGTWLRTVVAGTMTALAIALLQSGVPGHVVDVDTMLLNVTGVALSCLLLFPPLRTWLRRHAPEQPPGQSPGQPRAYGPLPVREEPSQGSTPRTARVGIAP